MWPDHEIFQEEPEFEFLKAFLKTRIKTWGKPNQACHRAFWGPGSATSD